DVAAPLLNQIDSAVQQSIRELRTVSYLLHPPLLDEAGLRLALQHYVDGFRERSGLIIDVDIVPDLSRQSPEVELALFRVVQEALTNVSRHSNSPSALIRLARATARGRQCIVLTIKDSGRGTAAARSAFARYGYRARNGVGLGSMEERLHQIGGWLDIDSGAGGTTVTAAVPERQNPPRRSHWLDGSR